MTISINQLRAIEAVASHGSFSAAAKSLGISQPSVSNHVTALEGKFKTRLFDRNGYNTTPTHELTDFIPKIRSILLLAQELEDQLNQKKDLKTGSLRIGYSTYQIAVPILTRFMKRYPDIAVEATAMASDDLMEKLEAGHLDVACITAKEMPAGLSGVETCKMEVMLAVSPDHPFAKRDYVDIKELHDQPLIQREKSSVTRRMFEAQAALAQVRVQNVLAVGSWGAILELVRGNVGIGVGLDVEVMNAPDIVAVKLRKGGVSASQFIAHLPDRKMMSTVQAFIEVSQEAPV